MGKRLAKGTVEHDKALEAIRLCEPLAQKALVLARLQENRVRGPRGYGSALKPWLGGAS